MVAMRSPAARVVLVECEADLVALARQNIHLNRFDARVAALQGDMLAPTAQRRAAGLLPGSFDLALTNPPWFDEGKSRPSPDLGRAKAHVLPAGSRHAWLRSAADLLVPRGSMVMIHRADALPGLLADLSNRFGGLALRFVHPRAGDPAIRLLLRAAKGSRAPLRVLPPLVLHQADGRFTLEAEGLHQGIGLALD
jgi:tRNA1(Val) A37 N6-methylase TrmN6